MTKPIPDGYNSVTPYLIVDDAERALEFYKTAFGAEEKFRLPMAGKIGHAEIKIGDSFVMLADEFPEMGHLGPNSRGGPTSSIVLYVEDVDSSFKKALEAGAKEQRPVENQFWGDRMGTLTDPFGHQWSLATHVEDVPEAEMQTRMEAFSDKQKETEPA
ncbi:MAG: VOC family protein [Pseudomonadota bacterium]|nr:VOC family protein [Pseudomonadota bacterium]